MVGNCLRPTVRALGQSGWIERANHSFGILKRLGDHFEQRCASRSRCHLAAGRFELLVVSCSAAQVRGQALHASGDMPQLESDWCETVRPRPNLRVAQAGGPLCEILPHLHVGVQRRRNQRMDSFERSPEPRFNKTRFNRIIRHACGLAARPGG